MRNSPLLFFLVDGITLIRSAELFTVSNDKFKYPTNDKNSDPGLIDFSFFSRVGIVFVGNRRRQFQRARRFRRSILCNLLVLNAFS